MSHEFRPTRASYNMLMNARRNTCTIMTKGLMQSHSKIHKILQLSILQAVSGLIMFESGNMFHLFIWLSHCGLDCGLQKIHYNAKPTRTYCTLFIMEKCQNVSWANQMHCAISKGPHDLVEGAMHFYLKYFHDQFECWFTHSKLSFHCAVACLNCG